MALNLSHRRGTLPNPQVTNANHRAYFGEFYPRPEPSQKTASLPASLPPMPFQIDLTMVYLLATIKAHFS